MEQLSCTYSVTTTVTKTVEDIYGCPDPKIPEGYEVRDFRIPQVGDIYLHKGTSLGLLQQVDGTRGPREPRLILHKNKKEVIPGSTTYQRTVQEVYGEPAVVIPEGYTFVSFDLVKLGDSFISTYKYDNSVVAAYPVDVGKLRIIVAKTGSSELEKG